MTMQSLQNILKLENELHAVEKSEEEKARLWLKQQHREILRVHEQDLSTFEHKRAKARNRAEKEASRDAEKMVQEAKDHAEYLVGKSDSILRSILENFLNKSVGNIP